MHRDGPDWWRAAAIAQRAGLGRATVSFRP